MIYLDSAATTKPKKEVIDAMMPYFTDEWYNPSSLYSPSTVIKKKIEEARSIVGKFIGAKGNEIYFTSGGSECNSWVIQGFVNECLYEGTDPIVITSTIEHKSIMDCVEDLNTEFYLIGVDKDGFVNIDDLENYLKRIVSYEEDYPFGFKILVSLQFANNEVGVIQPIKEISDLVHKYGGIFHTDAVQALSQIPIDVNKLGIDMLSASAHKIGAPKGIGFLYKKDGIKIKPLIYGSQMDGLRGSTENVPYIIGLAKAIELCDFSSNDYMIELREYMIDQLVKKFGCKLNGCPVCRLANNINVTFPQGITGESLLYTLELSNIYVSTGSACNSYSIEPSYVLKAIGLTDEQAMRTIRISLSDNITYEDIDKVIKEINTAIKLISE